MIIAIDFDGTCVTRDYPNIGKDIGAVPVLQALIGKKHKLILYTMRCDERLEDAKNWFKENGIELYACQLNPDQKNWTTSNKCYAQLYIDDAALGAPLLYDESKSPRPFISWPGVINLLKIAGIL